MSMKDSALGAVYALFHDKLTMTAGVASVGVIATWEIWLKGANNFAASNLPLATFAMVCVTILVRLFPRAPSPTSGAKDAGRTAWGWAKRFGLIAGIATALFAAFAFFKSDAKAMPAQPSGSSVVGKRKKPNDDAGDVDADDDDEVPDSDSNKLPPWFLKAKSQVGVTEALSSGKANTVVRDMFSAVNGWKRTRPDGTEEITADPRKVAWCAVFANWCLQPGVAGTRSAMARSFGRSRAFARLAEPRIGCIAVCWRGSHDDGQTGHVGFYAGEAGPNHVWIFGGNQGDAVSIAKFPKSRLRGAPDLGYFWPRGKLESKTGQGAVVTATSTAAGTGAVAYAAVSEDVPTQAAPSTVETVTGVLEKVQQPLEQSGHPRAMRIALYIGLALLAIGLGGALFTWYRHSKDHTEGKL